MNYTRLSSFIFSLINPCFLTTDTHQNWLNQKHTMKMKFQFWRVKRKYFCDKNNQRQKSENIKEEWQNSLPFVYEKGKLGRSWWILCHNYKNIKSNTLNLLSHSKYPLYDIRLKKNNSKNIKTYAWTKLWSENNRFCKIWQNVSLYISCSCSSIFLLVNKIFHCDGNVKHYSKANIHCLTRII